MKHVVIVGAGTVGAELAGLLVRAWATYRVTVIDIAPGLAEGVALDLRHAAAIADADSPIVGTTTWDAVDGADMIVVTSGTARRPEDESRDDLLALNARIVREVAASAYGHARDAVVVLVTNPVDVLCSLFLEAGFPPERVLGMGGVLDSGRFRSFIAEAAEVAPSEVVNAIVLGRHGDRMVPLVSGVRVQGKQLFPGVLSREATDAVVRRTIDGGHEIVKLLKTRSTQFGPAQAVFRMIEPMLADFEAVLPTMVVSDGAYGTLPGEFIGLPAVLTAGGVRGIATDLTLAPDELDALRKASEDVAEQRRKLIAQ
jgi:malate dehydrogenase